MSGVHKHPTISFRVLDREREMIEAKILASGMQKKDYKDYFVRSCIYTSEIQPYKQYTKPYQNDMLCKHEITTFIRKIEPEKEFE